MENILSMVILSFRLSFLCALETINNNILGTGGISK